MDFCDERGAAGHPALVMSALLMPFCSVADEVRDVRHRGWNDSAQDPRAGLYCPQRSHLRNRNSRHEQVCPALSSCVRGGESGNAGQALFSCARCRECAAQNSGLLE